MDTNDFLLEVIAFTIESCSVAQAAGASRIELCDNPADGGTTPSFGFIQAARKALKIDLYVMIRPRGGDFLYGDAEFEVMQGDIRARSRILAKRPPRTEVVYVPVFRQV